MRLEKINLSPFPFPVPFSFPDMFGGYIGLGNIDADPLFGNSAAGDYHLQPSSACIDTGINTCAPPEDKDCITRPQDGNGDGMPVCDMGAYEYVS